MRAKTYLLVLGILAGLPSCADSVASGYPGPVARATVVRVFERDSLLYDIRDAGVGPAGEVWVLSSFEPFVYRYSAGGKLLGRFGRRGKGPGEMLNPWSLVLTGDTARPVRVWDVGSQRVVTYSGEGNVVEEHSIALSPTPVRSDLRAMTYGEATKLRGLGPGYIVQDEPGGVLRQIDFVMSQLVRIGPTGAVLDTIIDFQEKFSGGLATLGRATTFVPIPLWTTCPDGRLAVLDPFRPAIVWTDPESHASQVQLLALPAAEIGDEDVLRHLTHTIRLERNGSDMDAAEMKRLVDRAFRQFRSNYPNKAPPAVDLLCDSDSNLWIERFATDADPAGFGTTWVRLSGGTPHTAVQFPDGFRPRVLSGGVAVGILQDSLNVQSVAVAALPPQHVPTHPDDR